MVAIRTRSTGLREGPLFSHTSSSRRSSQTLRHMTPKRIHITGNAGSGKSTLANKLGQITGLPVHGLDSIVWSSGWKKTAPEERRIRELDLITHPAWIIEGVSSLVRETADLVIFLDYPRSTCAWRCAKRNWRYLFRSRPELPPNCPELLILPTLFKIVWKFSSAVRPKILSEGSRTASGERFVHLKGDRDLVVYLQAAEVRYQSDVADG